MRLFFGSLTPEIGVHPDEEQHILKVLRLKDGDEIAVTDGLGNAVRGKLQIVGKKVTVRDSAPLPSQPTPASNLHIAIAPTKNIDRIEFFLEKATEMQVNEVTFLLCDHSERKQLNFEKLHKQMVTASKQSLRFRFPVLHPLLKLEDFLQQCNPVATFVAHCDPAFERLPLQNVPACANPTLLIGPEGDFSTREILLLRNKGIKAVSLGESRLRTETAGVLVAAWHYLQ